MHRCKMERAPVTTKSAIKSVVQLKPVLAIASGAAVTLWDCEKDHQERTTFAPFFSRTSVADGATAATIADLQWNHTGKVLCCARQPESPCDETATSADADDSIVLLSAQTGRVLSSFGKQLVPAAATFGGKSRYLCIASLSGSVVVWDLKKQSEARRFQLTDSGCHQACLDPTDTFVYALGDSNLAVYRLREAKLVAELHQPSNDAARSRSLTCFTISSQVPYYTAVGSSNGSVTVYDLTTTTTTPASFETPLKKFQLSNTAIVQVALDVPLNRLAVASESHVGVYEYESSKVLFEVSLDHDKVTCMSLLENCVAVGRQSGSVTLWDWEMNKQVATFDSDNPIQRVVFGPPGATSPLAAPKPKVQATPQPAPSLDDNRTIPSQPKASTPHATSTIGSQQQALLNPTNKPEYVHVSVVQEIVREEVERLRDEMQTAFMNLHVDMLRQFQQQSEDLNGTFTTQLRATENRILREENRLLKQTNEILRQSHQPKDKTNAMLE